MQIGMGWDGMDGFIQVKVGDRWIDRQIERIPRERNIWWISWINRWTDGRMEMEMEMEGGRESGDGEDLYS